jgi:hypothetical protein
MKKVFFLMVAVLASLLLTSCGGGTTPGAFNDRILKANDVISEIKNSYDETLTQLIQNNSYGSIVAETDSALTKIDVELKGLRDLQSPKGGEEFKETALKTFEGIKAIIESGKAFASLTAESTQEEFDKLEQAFYAKEDEADKLFKELQSAQKAFSEKFGYKLK